MDERVDRERTAADIDEKLKAKYAGAVKRVVKEITCRMQAKSGPLLVAFDGGTSSGKSTLALLVAAEVSVVVVQGDDFCQTQIDWSTKSSDEKSALCIDWKRAREQALEPLLAGKTATWHPFNFKTGIGLADYVVVRKPKPVIILDGAYSSNPSLSGILDLTVLLNMPADIRMRRHNAREGHDDAAWHAIWDEVESYYFTKIRPPSCFDIVLSVS